jgi:hypothetical protein
MGNWRVSARTPPRDRRANLPAAQVPAGPGSPTCDHAWGPSPRNRTAMGRKRPGPCHTPRPASSGAGSSGMSIFNRLVAPGEKYAYTSAIHAMDLAPLNPANTHSATSPERGEMAGALQRPVVRTTTLFVVFSSLPGAVVQRGGRNRPACRTCRQGFTARECRTTDHAVGVASFSGNLRWPPPASRARFGRRQRALAHG